MKLLNKLLLFFEPFLIEFKWYRKKIGGKWYKVYDQQRDFGLAGDTIHWTQEEPEQEKIIEKENYSAY